MTFARDGSDQGVLVPTVGPNERQRRQDARLAHGAIVRRSVQAVAPRSFHYDTGDEVAGQSPVVHPAEEFEPTPPPAPEEGPWPRTIRQRLLDAERLAERRSGYRSSPGLRRLQEYRVNRTLAIVAQWLQDMMTPPELDGVECENNTLLGLSKHLSDQIEWTEGEEPS